MKHEVSRLYWGRDRKARKCLFGLIPSKTEISFDRRGRDRCYRSRPRFGSDRRLDIDTVRVET
jgi:hypothetical protein